MSRMAEKRTAEVLNMHQHPSSDPYQALISLWNKYKSLDFKFTKKYYPNLSFIYGDQVGG